MYLVDEQHHIIHDLSGIKYECHVKQIPEDKKRKIFTMESVRRMISTEHRPQYNGCRYCLPDYHQFDMNAIFRG